MSSGRLNMYGRTLARCQALQLLFQAEVTGRTVADVLAGEYVLSDGPLDEYGERVARGADEHLPEIDRVLSTASENWSLSRMSSVDRNLLRLSLYELLFVKEIDAAVIIDESVEIAKAFGCSDESSRFVNGMLGKVQADIDAGIDVVERARAAELAEAQALEAERASERGSALADTYVEDDYVDPAYADGTYDPDNDPFAGSFGAAGEAEADGDSLYAYGDDDEGAGLYGGFADDAEDEGAADAEPAVEGDVESVVDGGVSEAE